MKKSPMPPRTKPLERRKALRRTAIVQAIHAAVTSPVRRSKTTVGEFPPKVRRLLYRRFDGRCAYCGDPLPVKHWTGQHRRARGMGGSKDPVTSSAPNGVAVHELPCHRRIEDDPGQALLDGYRIPQGADPQQFDLKLWDGRRVYLNAAGGYWAEPTEAP